MDDARALRISLTQKCTDYFTQRSHRDVLNRIRYHYFLPHIAHPARFVCGRYDQRTMKEFGEER